MVSLESVEAGGEDAIMLQSDIDEHVEATGSVVGKALLDDWDTAVTHFVKVFPHDLRRVMQEKRKRQAEVVANALEVRA